MAQLYHVIDYVINIVHPIVKLVSTAMKFKLSHEISRYIVKLLIK